MRAICTARASPIVFLVAATLSVAAQTPTHAEPADQPSFSCSGVTSHVNQLICQTPRLARLDTDLALVFNNMRGQSLDQKKLRADEDAWLHNLQHSCSDIPCIEQQYRQRVHTLRDESLRIASPATYQETRSFPVSPAIWTEAQSVLGQPCNDKNGAAAAVIDGFSPALHFLPILLSQNVVVVREKAGVDLAFLLGPISGVEPCLIRDVVALPAKVEGNRFQQCRSESPALSGFGVRNPSTHLVDAFWSVDPDTQQVDRVPVGVLRIQKSLHCQQPESAD